MELVIRIPLDGNDLEETDFQHFVREALDASGINLEVGRAIEEEGFQDVSRIYSISAEYFKADIELTLTEVLARNDAEKVSE